MANQYTNGKHPNLMSGGVIEHTVDLTAATGTTAGGVASIANPLGVNLIIVDAILNITTPATTATNTIDAGVAANGTTSSDTLLDGRTTGVQISSARDEGGTNGKTPRLWGSSQYVTATASATLAGMVGTLTLICVRA